MHIESKIVLSASVQMPGDYITSAVFLKNRGMLASTSRWSNITLWDFESGQAIHSIQGRSESWKIAASPDEGSLAIASDRGIQICDIAAGAAPFDLETRLRSISTLSFHPRLKMVAYGTRESGSFVEINNLDGDDIFSQIGHSRPVGLVSFSPDGSVLATYSNDELFFWSVWGPNRLYSSFRFDSQPKLIAFSHDWRFVATAGSNSIEVWQLESRVADSYMDLHLRKLKSLSLAVHGPFASIAFSPDGTTLAIGGDPLWLVDLIDDSVTEVVNPDFTTGEVVFSHDGSFLAVCGGTRGSDQMCMIKMWSLSP